MQNLVILMDDDPKLDATHYRFKALPSSHLCDDVGEAS